MDEGINVDSPRKQFMNALENQHSNGRVPHFELVFYLTMEAFGKIHPLHRNYSQWGQMSTYEQNLHRNEIADIYIMTAERFEHNAIFIHTNPESVEETIRLIDIIREKTGNRYFIMRHGDATFSIPAGSHMNEFSFRLVDDRKSILTEADIMVNNAIKDAEIYQKYGILDGFALCSDYCFNSGPFISPLMFSEVITPFLA
jgi:uroporphyrinogen decarboxylase